VPTAPLWERTVTLLQRGDVESSSALLKYFNRRDRRIVEAWIAGLKNPARAFSNPQVVGDSPYHQRMAEHLLRHWAREDMQGAMTFWRANAHRFGLGGARMEMKLADNAVLAAKRRNEQAPAMLAAAEGADVLAWRVRLSLKDKNWSQCSGLIKEMPSTQRDEDRWQYWQARCLQLQGFDGAADKIYQKLAAEFSYYGFLAADRVGEAYQIETVEPTVDTDIVAALYRSSELERAIEFFLVDIPWEGRKVWNQEIKSFNETQLIAASYVARSVGWYDRALDAMRSASAYDALTSMYPMPYEGYVDKVARRYKLEPAFIYAVMRRESLFIPDIKSSAGAIGLMQLMPATAKQMGVKLGINTPRWRLIESHLNIQLGTKYLRHVLDRVDENLALAAAAYNAGPSRVKKWTENGVVAPDIWVETIPFNETRDYVKAVLFSTIVFQWLQITALNGLE